VLVTVAAVGLLGPAALLLGRDRTGAPAKPSSELIEGEVRDDRGSVAGAVVRIQATPHATTTDAEGRFRLRAAGASQGPLTLTAWARGYYCGGPARAKLGQNGVRLTLRAHADGDNRDYAWLRAVERSGEGSCRNCAECHSRRGTDFPWPLPVDEWLLDAHSQSATNARLRTMYLGTDVRGNRSPATRYARVQDYGRVPLRPDRSKPYFGPGYRLDFPETAGNCAACHAPTAAVDRAYQTDPTQVQGAGTEGVACDFCHKIWDVRLDRATGLPPANAPGVLSLEFRRPPLGRQFFAGPYDDVATGEDTYSPLQRQSRFCAACHFGVFWDTVIYNSFGEWLASPYSDPEKGRTCQDCHMPPSGARLFALPEKKGLARDPATIFSHRMPGAADEAFLRKAVAMQATARRQGQEIVVEVAIRNEFAGHHLPTDSPLRHMILVVQAADDQGRAIVQSAGPKVPAWCGEGDPAQGCYGGLPGKAFAKVLEDRWTGLSPTGAYWNPTNVVSDNRIPALATDRSRYIFRAPVGGAQIEVRLLFRRAFKELMEQKGWNDPDILMGRQTLVVGAREG